MRSKIPLAPITLALSGILLSTSAFASPPFVPGQVVVKGDTWDFLEYKTVKRLPKSGLTILEVGTGNERAAIMKLRNKNRWASLNLIATKSATVNDAFRSFQWHFDNIQADSAWDLSTGTGVQVAVLDTGLTTGGPDGISAVCVSGARDFVNSDNNPADGDGHGTHVSGTIAQATNNGSGSAGLAYGACIMPVKVLDDSGSGSFAQIAEGIYHAVDNGADVINMSLGINARYGVTNDAVMDPALQYAADNDVVVVAASGNDGNRKNISYPAIYPTVIAVGATDARDQVVRYSNRGTGLDLVAPGGDTGRDDNGDGYGDGVLQETYINGAWGSYFFQGTSMASPHVAAASAMLLSHGASPADIRNLLQNNTKDIGDNGFDSTSGWGLIQVYDALAAVNGSSGDRLPDANFEFNCVELTCSFDASISTDDNGIVSYGWSFGDGATGTGQTVSYTYAAGGFYDVVLTVEDTTSQPDSLTQTVTVTTETACTDADGDGFCAEVNDCNDSNNHIYPGHNDSKGRWGKDGLDNDCNGTPDA